MNYFLNNNPDKLYTASEQILEQMKADGAEATMMFIHWGVEYNIKENSLQDTMAQKLCDLGFDVIVGGHPHVVQPVDLLTSTVDESHKTVVIYLPGQRRVQPEKRLYFRRSPPTIRRTAFCSPSPLKSIPTAPCTCKAWRRCLPG